jgi:hypothetical protein
MKTQTANFTFAPVVTKDEKGVPKRFSGVAYSGGVIPNYGWMGDAVIDLSTFSVPTGSIFALVDHCAEKRAGKLTARVEGNQILIDGEFFTSTESGREVAALFAEGAPWQLSVGINGKVTRSDDQAIHAVNGQQLKANALFSECRLQEVSFVPVGADPQTTVAAFSAQQSTTAGVNDMDIEKLKAQIAELTASLEAEKKRADEAVSALEKWRKEKRKDEVAKMSADLGRTFSDAEIVTFSALPDDAFSSVSTILLASKPAAPAHAEHLFSEQATNGKATEQSATLAQMNAQLLAQMTVQAKI